MLRTRFSVVPISMLNGAGSEPIEAHPGAIGGDREDFRAVAAIDLGGVDARAAFEQIVVVAGIPDHAVVAGLAEQLIVAVAAGQHVIAVAAEQKVEAALAEQRVVACLAEQHVVAGAAGQDVVAGAAEQIGTRQRAVHFAERDDVVAALAERLDQARIGDGRRAAQNLDRATIGENLAGGIAADRQIIVKGVREQRQNARVRGEGTGNRHCFIPSKIGKRKCAVVAEMLRQSFRASVWV